MSSMGGGGGGGGDILWNSPISQYKQIKNRSYSVLYSFYHLQLKVVRLKVDRLCYFGTRHDTVLYDTTQYELASGLKWTHLMAD